MRGGAFKPRTSPYTFQGKGVDGLKLLRDAAGRKLPVVTELMDVRMLDAFLEHGVDVIQIGTRNMQNFDLLKAVSSTTPVILKRGMSATISEWLMAAQYIAAGGNQLEADHSVLLMRKARLEAQRDGNDNFIMPMLVGLSRRNVDFELAYSAENDTFSRLAEMYRSQVQALQNQRPRVQAEIDAVTDQIAKQKEHLGIVNSHLADLESLFGKGLLRKDVLLNRADREDAGRGTIVEFAGARSRVFARHMGDLDIRLGDVKANYLRQTLAELQDTSQRLREVENGLGPAHRLLEVKAQGASGDVDEPDTPFASAGSVTAAWSLSTRPTRPCCLQAMSSRSS